MADTFSIDTGSPVQQGGSAATQAPQQRIDTVASGPTQIQPQAANSGFDGATANALLKLGSDILAPKVKEAAQAQYMEGVKTAMTGEAITDIVKERPWWAEVFGPSSAVQGARAYSVAQTVAKFGADMEAQMPKLAQQGPEALDASMKGLMKGLQTGDPAADMAITAQVVDQMAPLYKRHAKEHVAYLQEKASDAQVDTWSALAAGYQQRAAASVKDPTKVSKEDVEADAQRLLGSMSPFADQPDKSYDHNVARFLGASAQAGNFQVVKLFKDNGLFDKLPPQYRSQLDATFRSAGRQALDKSMPTFAVDVAMATRDMAQNPAGIPARIAALNAKAAAATGVSEDYASLIPPSSVDNVIGNVLTSQAAQRSKEQEEAAGLALANSMLTVPGGVGPCKSIGVCKENAVEQAALTQWNQTPDPVKRAALLNNNGSETFGAIKSNLSAMLNTKDDTPGTQAAAKLYAGLNEEAKGRYFTADNQKLLDRYSQMIAGGEAPASAWQMARVVAPISKFYLDPKEKNETAKAIRSWVESKAEDHQGGVSGFIGVNGLTDRSIETAQMVVSSSVANGRAGNGIDRAVKRAMSDALNSGRLQLIGEHAVIGDFTHQQPLATMLSRGTDTMGEKAAADTFNHVLKDKAEKIEADLKEYTILRSDDQGGRALFQVELVTKDGSVKSFSINSDELRAAHASGLVKASTEKAAFQEATRGDPRTPVVDTGFGPTIVPR